MVKQSAAIVEHHLVDELNRVGFVMSGPECSFYPDGSLYWSDGREGAYAFCGRVRKACDAAGIDPIGHHRFRSLAPFRTSLFEGRVYELLYTGSYLAAFPRYEENGLLIGPGIGTGIDPKEYELNHLRIHIEFFRKADTRLAEDLAASIAVWFRTIGSRGGIWRKRNLVGHVTAVFSSKEGRLRGQRREIGGANDQHAALGDH